MSQAIQTDTVVLGAGPGGYTAAFRAADLGQRVVLVEERPKLGGVCLNVGCIPSKALLHAAEVMHQAEVMQTRGIRFGKPTVDLDALRNWKNGVVGKLTGGLSMLAKQRKVTVCHGRGVFHDPHTLHVTNPQGSAQTVTFKHAIVAVGSSPVKLPFLPDDPRIVDSTGALELAKLPKRMLVIGGGIIGLEMATVYAALGTAITVVEMADDILPGVPRGIVKPLRKRLDATLTGGIHCRTKVVRAEAKSKGITVSFEGQDLKSQTYDLVLVAVGRTPNGAGIQAEAAGITVDPQGFLPVDHHMRTQQPHIFAIGDVVGNPMLAHKAIPEGRVAAEVIAGMDHVFAPTVIPSVAYTNPEVAWVGLTLEEAKAQGIPCDVGAFPWAASGRALASECAEGLTQLVFNSVNHRVIGGAIVGTRAGDLIGEVAHAIEMGSEAADIALTIHPHPTLVETIPLAAEAFEGTLTDLYQGSGARGGG